MRNLFTILLVANVLCACSSSGGFVAGSEDYAGARTAAVAPVSDRRSVGEASTGRSPANIQHSIQRQLDSSGIFAGVVTLDRPDEGNEAEVIIEPALVESPGSGADDLQLRVRVTEKTNRTIVLDEQYRGEGRGDSLMVAIKELENDLERRYVR